jgi:hypothetical protein
MPRRTRAELESFLDKNTSVKLHDGRVITNKADLPSDAELAAQHRDHLTRVHSQMGQSGAEQKTLDDLQRQIDEADKEAGTHATKAAKPEAASSPPAGGGDTGSAAEALAKAHTAAELKALCDEHDCPHGTKDEMAAALAAKGVKPPQE